MPIPELRALLDELGMRVAGSSVHETALGDVAITIELPGAILGAFHDISYEQQSYALSPGDFFVAFTDGLIEARSEEGTFYGRKPIERGLREFLLPSTTSAPYVEGDRLYYVTAECQLRCLDTQGFGDGENNGPYREELFKDKAPVSVANFLQYAAEGFFDGTIFHRVIPGFMIQGGGLTPELVELMP